MCLVNHGQESRDCVVLLFKEDQNQGRHVVIACFLESAGIAEGNIICNMPCIYHLIPFTYIEDAFLKILDSPCYFIVLLKINIHNNT